MSQFGAEVCSKVPGLYQKAGEDGSHYWTYSLIDDAGTTITSINTSAGAADTWTAASVTIGALLGTARKSVQVQATKTSTPHIRTPAHT